MEARTISGNARSRQRLQRWQRAARGDGAYLVAQRLHAVRLNMDGYTAPRIGRVLGVHRSNVSLWLRHWQAEGLEGLLEVPRSGRPGRLSPDQQAHLDQLIDSGPLAYGFLSGVWTAPMVAQLIAEEFGVAYHPGHGRRRLHGLGFSLQRPGRCLIRANPQEQTRWVRHTYPRLKKKPATGTPLWSLPMRRCFRQDASLYRTWARQGHRPMIPTHGQRQTQKILGAVDLYAQGFYYHQDRVFNGLTYVGFLNQLAGHYPRQEVWVIQDNAAYHKAPEVQLWLAAHAGQFHLVCLPIYSPQFNAVEGIWHHTRVQATHNRYFDSPAELRHTLHSTFQSIQRRPTQIASYLNPFQ